ncbi:molybdenum cofactor cytidylyltransferase [Hasllibacter halocynthiae]|uniref:Molybdenum cofactor cytidylyltransferase n=1 Tax=Hasllibacter halocynthiae TaxID=595589 RepID=A0A2T0X8Q9_9RHOB|nr:molybdopterin-binding protein [Hasllibacter halocynthiae]PRY95295.1 molybdenum cofactor cytidylyltransferase [Hasllibacter halocynthiae]
MRFGPVPLEEAEGAILAHSVALPEGRLRKGRVLTPADLAALREAGQRHVTVARPGPDDVAEDEAARRLGAAVRGAGLREDRAATGRVNLRAAGPGLLRVDASGLHALNAVDPGITVATAAPFHRCRAGELVATAKIIPYAVPRPALDRACEAGLEALSLLPPVIPTAALILSEVPGGPSASKGVRSVEGRLGALGVAMHPPAFVPHDEGAIAAALLVASDAGAGLVLVLTASATSDARDTGPAALVAAGGTLHRFGMPVDPGNLLFAGTLRGRPVIGLPGCARSPAPNGADWVIERTICGVPPSPGDIARMGVGGLLKESPARGRPREG